MSLRSLLWSRTVPREPQSNGAAAPRRIWLDVGAHSGEKTLNEALGDPQLRVYAFEPNLALAVPLASQASNFFVVPMAVSETDGVVDFYINNYDSASSTLPFDIDGLANWTGGEELASPTERRQVPSIRLDTFFTRVGIGLVDFLKIDAQGADLAVVRSAGSRLKDIGRIHLEVQITEKMLYAGSATKAETVRYLEQAGFALESAELQTWDQEENLTFVNRAWK